MKNIIRTIPILTFMFSISFFSNAQKEINTSVQNPSIMQIYNTFTYKPNHIRYGPSPFVTTGSICGCIPPATPTVTENMLTLTSSAATGNQWYLNGNTIIGATSQSYTTTQNGDYMVCVSNGNACSSCSTPYTVSTTGVVESSLADVNIFPNPANGQFILTVPINKYEIEIYTALGEKIYDKEETANNKPKTEIFINTAGLANGIYFVRLKNNTGEIVTKKISVINN